MTLRKQMNDYRLTTAEILYHLPDYPHLLQSFIWQNIDLPPGYPALNKFLTFWNQELDARLHSVRVTSGLIMQPSRITPVDTILTLH